MKRILLGSCLFMSYFASWGASFQRPIDQIINQVDPSINMGMKVVDLNTGKTLYERLSSQPFIPASNMKLFSDAAALMALGPDYRFQTKLSTNATSLDAGVLKGSLYLYLPGDPSFNHHDLRKLFRQLSAMGVQRIDGNVVLVSNNSVVSPYAPGRSPGDFKYSYGAPIAPVVLDENRLTVTVNPAAHQGEPALIELSETAASPQINNQVKTVAAGQRCGIDFNLDSENQLTVHGCVAVGQWAVQQRIALRNPLRYSQDVIRHELQHLHIALDGQVLLGSAPSATLLLSSHCSKPISQLMADTLKPSDNLYADSLFLHTAAKLGGKPVNWEQAQPIIKNFLQQQTGINFQRAVLIDGSGLSRNDLLTIQQTVDLLRYLHDRFPLAYEYIAALPVAGIDGTLRRRFRNPSEQGLLRAKTGTMTGVISLSGYLYSANAHILAFSIFINKRPGTKPNVSGRYRSMVDTLCSYLLRQKPDNNFFNLTQYPRARAGFQHQPTYADRQRSNYAKWRQVESAVKHALQGQGVTIVYRGNHLVLKDHANDMNRIWSTLQQLGRKYTFAVALKSPTAPAHTQQPPLLLWVKTPANTGTNERIWTLRDAIS